MQKIHVYPKMEKQLIKEERLHKIEECALKYFNYLFISIFFTTLDVT